MRLGFRPFSLSLLSVFFKIFGVSFLLLLGQPVFLVVWFIISLWAIPIRFASDTIFG